MPISRDDAASAAVWIAAQLPPKVCKAMVEEYNAAERREHERACNALEVVFAFVRAYWRS